MNGVQRYGFPRKAHTDHGGENIAVWRTMMDEHSSNKCVQHTMNALRGSGETYTDQ